MSLGIGDVTQGYSRVGAEAYKQDINAKAITETCQVLRDIENIRTALEAGWQGQAQLNFMTNLQNAVTVATETIESLRTNLENEFAAIEEAWAKQDSEMVPVE